MTFCLFCIHFLKCLKSKVWLVKFQNLLLSTQTLSKVLSRILITLRTHCSNQQTSNPPCAQKTGCCSWLFAPEESPKTTHTRRNSYWKKLTEVLNLKMIPKSVFVLIRPDVIRISSLMLCYVLTYTFDMINFVIQCLNSNCLFVEQHKRKFLGYFHESAEG